jgi:hypothetical protein
LSWHNGEAFEATKRVVVIVNPLLEERVEVVTLHKDFSASFVRASIGNELGNRREFVIPIVDVVF